MPYSYAQYAGNGALTSFSVPFPYLLRAHVKVFIGYNLLTGSFTSELVDGTGFTWTSATQIQATTAPASGQTLTVIRQTPNTALVVGWNDGSNLIAGDLNTADLQNLYVVQESLDRSAVVAAAQTQASADAAAALAGVANALPYGPVGTVAAIPASAANGTRVEVANSTGIESFSPLTGRPAGFTGSSQIKVRLVYATAGATWQWVDYAVADPDGRYVLQSSISSSTTSTSTTSVANSLAVKTATDAAAAAQTTANTAVTNAAAAQTTANTAVTNAAAAQTTANTAVTNAAAAQTTANAAQTTANAAVPQTQTASTTQAGIVQLDSSTSSTSAAKAATASAVKAVQDAIPASARLCSAWVNFNGTGTVAIRASYNVSSITDNGTGDYTVNFTTALTDANYSVAVAVANDLYYTYGTQVNLTSASGAMTAASCRLLTFAEGTGSGSSDMAIICASFFR